LYYSIISYLLFGARLELGKDVTCTASTVPEIMLRRKS